MISTTISNIELDTCIYNASGCWCTTETELDDLLESDSGAIVSKSSTLNPREGNPEPRLYKNDCYGSINSMGVPNLGYKFYADYGNKIITKPYIQSVIPFSIEDLKTILADINELISKPPRLVEVNLSCPNIIKKAIVAYDYNLFNDYLKCINDLTLPNLIIGIKLPPYYQLYEFDAVADIIRNYDKIKFVTCINSIVNGLIINIDKEETAIYPKDGFGGIGGVYCKPTALANVNQFYRRLGDKIDIIGCGGVVTGEDVFGHILAGASAVQVGTEIVKRGPTYFKILNEQLINIINKKGYKCINEFRGRLKVTESVC